MYGALSESGELPALQLHAGRLRRKLDDVLSRGAVCSVAPGRPEHTGDDEYGKNKGRGAS